MFVNDFELRAVINAQNFILIVNLFCISNYKYHICIEFNCTLLVGVVFSKIFIWLYSPDTFKQINVCVGRSFVCFI